MNIKKIIREELDGFKDSSKEDWGWSEDVNPYLFNGHEIWIDIRGLSQMDVKKIADYVNINGYCDGSNYMVLHCGEDGTDYHPEENNHCCMDISPEQDLVQYGRDYLEFGVDHSNRVVIHGMDILKEIPLNESDGFKDSTEEDWAWTEDVDDFPERWDKETLVKYLQTSGELKFTLKSRVKPFVMKLNPKKSLGEYKWVSIEGGLKYFDITDAVPMLNSNASWGWTPIK